MSGYTDRSEPFGREPRPSLGEWLPKLAVAPLARARITTIALAISTHSKGA